MKIGSRRVFGVALLVLGAVAWSDTLSAAPDGKADDKPSASQRPNIVIIMADDMGYSDLGCYGSEIATPNLDRIAGAGVRFTQFYNASRCCPTRASLLTGLYPHQAGMGGMADQGCEKPPSPYQGFLNDHCVTIAETLKPAGYQVLMAGKWHVGERRPYWPTDRGFDRYFGLISGASNYFRLGKGRQMAVDAEPFVPQGDDFYMTDAFTDYAVRFLEETRGSDKPFFLYLAYTCPHWPLHAWPEDIAKYRGKYREGWDALRRRRHQRMIELGVVDPRWPLSPLDAPAWDTVKDKDAEDLKMAVYAAQIDRMDQNIGRVLEKIRDLGVEDNTLVLFLADNGGCHERINRGRKGVPPGPKDGYLSYGKSWANASNTPFRRYKHWVHEGGISTPLIAYWPAVIKSPRITDQPGHIIDLMATCVDLAEAKYPETRHGHAITPMQGKSLAPILRGGDREPQTLYWEHEGNRAVRQGDWKIVAVDGGDWELYNMRRDRTELNNLAATHPDKVARMASLYDAWAKRCGVDKRPETRPIKKQTVKKP